jgi:hypothetical protein
VGTIRVSATTGNGRSNRRYRPHCGSIKIAATETTTVRIAEVDDLSIDDARLIYRARLRTENVTGRAYLEMWCVFSGQGEFFSRALHAPLSGTNDWVHQETPFLLQEGQTPNLVRLNLVIEGGGTVWIDQVTLSEAPQRPGG